MKVGKRQRFRVDHFGLEVVCDVWWAEEHGSTFDAQTPETKADVVKHLKGLMKSRDAQTPGDLAALEAFEVQTIESAKRAREAAKQGARERSKVERLRTLHTRALMDVLSLARGTGSVHEGPPGEFHPGAGPQPELAVSVALLKAELATREHLPNRKERESVRQQKAKAARANRSRASRR